MELTLVLVEIETDVVLNVIVATEDYVPPAGVRAIEALGARIGWPWNDGDQVEAPRVNELLLAITTLAYVALGAVAVAALITVLLALWIFDKERHK